MKRIFSGILVMLLLAAIVPLAFDIQPARGETRTITVPDDYPTIQEAIYSANEGDTVFVRNGTYPENVVVNKTVSLIGENRSSTFVDGEGGDYAINVTSNNVVVSGFTVLNAQNGVLLENSNGSRISLNVFQSCFNGILLVSSCNNTILENMAANNNYGIRLHEPSHYNTIEGNTVVGNGDGFHLVSDYNKITKNNVYDNMLGIRIWSSHNTITGNELADNQIRVEGPYWNTIYHNNFHNVAIEWWIPPDNNTWTNGCEGNFWSDYDGVELDGDGVGDTKLPWKGVDNCPLMNRYWILADVNHDLIVDIFDVVKITASYESIPSDPRWNPHADIAEPYEVIDIFDVVACTGHYEETRARSLWGLVGYWRLDEGKGDIASDSTENANHGFLMNGPTWVNGKYGKALSFDGLDDRVDVPVLYTSSPSALTVSAWINSPLTKIGYIFYHGDNGEFVLHNGKRPDEFMNGEGNPTIAGFTVKLSDSLIYTVNSPQMTSDVWHNLVGVWIKGVALRIYVDGQLAGENTAIPDYSLFDPSSGYLPSIGVYNRANNAQNTFFSGTMDQVMIYNRALSPQEVMAEYTGSIP